MDRQTEYPGYPEEPVAIVGTACRFPGGSSSPPKLWDLLRRPRDVRQAFDPERLNLQRFYHAQGETHGSTDVCGGSYLLQEDSRLFDAAFFGISPAEAAGMDPQQRVLLETVYEALESAGLPLDRVRGSATSVHVGVMTNDYAHIQHRDPETIPKYAATGTANSILSNRISYVFDLKGASETIDTACSSSLVALHHAVRALRSGDSEMAVVAGVNLILDATPYITESKLHMLSPDARSRMWDKAANGYARGEGSAALILKPLSRALRDGDHVEAVVRHTAVNSDGQSAGITMPHAPAQAALIRQTYLRAGLDPARDRPQYFECHGTGTPAGDPVEASAIHDTFVAGAGGAAGPSTAHPLYVGSIKTVVGHLEGCAGLAGVIKVVLAIRHRTIPPNLLFDELNPAISRFYGPLQIPVTAVPWPEPAPGAPARASVNSFGFGGTNAHAIIESFGSAEAETRGGGGAHVSGPLLFSAASGRSLLRTVRDHVQYLTRHPDVDLDALARLLQTRRTTHRFRASFAASSRDGLLETMGRFVSSHERSPAVEIGYQPRLVNPKEVPGVLGVFTGQGAQWPAMGRRLLARSPLFRRTIESCEAVLSRDLPAPDRPDWSLVAELSADGASSRLSEAAISQPLLTALQIGLVEVLRASGVRFDAVVGHSSGEIAAVYACGIITQRGAMQIAYYRGLHAKLAAGARGQKGAMLAAGLPLDKAARLCGRAELAGRVGVAASNAPQSTTLSGDADAIRLLKEQLDGESTFARQLQVDTAYHSHHMAPCAEPYLRSLLACDIEVRPPEPGAPVWSSSVRGDAELLRRGLDALQGPYWVANMVQTVLFSQAVESSIWHGGPFDLAVEVGPHPALQGPVEQTLKAAYGQAPPYAGVLRRGGDDTEAFAAALGTAWSQLGPSLVDFAGYRRAFEGPPRLSGAVVKGLPPYSWDHDRVYWRESRISRRYRTGASTGHELLGRRTPDDNDRELRWRNVLKLSEMSWLRGHQVLGEVLLPGAAYVSVAVEAGRAMAEARGAQVRLLEVEGVDIHRPVVVPDDKDGVETLFTATVLSGGGGSDTLRASFSYYVCANPSSDAMVRTCSGSLAVQLGAPETGALPPREAADAVSSAADLVAIDRDQMYALFADIGLDYSGAFRGVVASSRCLGFAAAAGRWPRESLGTSSDAYLVHPAVLDVAFQTLFVARAHPSSGQITSALLPSRIDRVSINPAVRLEAGSGAAEVTADIKTWVVGQTSSSLRGDLDIYDAASGETLLQVEGLDTRMVGEPDASRDRPVFAKTVWARDASLALADPVRDAGVDTELLRLTEALERTALFYVRKLLAELSGADRKSSAWYHQRMLEAFEGHLSLAEDGRHPVLRRGWLDDEPSVLGRLDAQHPGSIELQMVHAVGRSLADVVRGKVQLLEVMSRDDMLNRFYMLDRGCMQINNFVGRVMQQITFKFPRCKILEIGAGTGGTTWSALQAIHGAYDSYTFTDISPGFFAAAADKFADSAHKMIFKVLDVERGPEDQGFAAHSYDVVIAANVLHATRNLEATLRNVRSLLRPGGYAVLFETTGIHTLRVPFTFGGLQGWWLGDEPGRRLRPIVSTLGWDELLRETGFTGADRVVHDVADEGRHTLSLIVSQAVDDAYLRLRDPLPRMAERPPPADPVLLVGGRTLATSKVLAGIKKLLPAPWQPRLRIVGSIDDVADVPAGTHAICLHEVDEPLFASPVTAGRMAALQGLLMGARDLVWVTTAGGSRAPRAAMFRGIARVMPAEVPQLRLQVLGLEAAGEAAGAAPATTARHCVEALLRLMEAAEPGSDGDDENSSPSPGSLWAHEPEVEILAGGSVMIPRVVEDQVLNETYTASRRVLTKTVVAAAGPDGDADLAVEAVPGPTRMALQAIASGAAAPAGAAGAAGAAATNTKAHRLRVQQTVHIPAAEGSGLYLACGHFSAPGHAGPATPALAVSEANASLLDVEPGCLVPLARGALAPDALAAAATRLLAQALSTLAARSRLVLVYGADRTLAAVIADRLRDRGADSRVQVRFASSSPDAPASWIKLHCRCTRRAVEKAVPHGVDFYVDCSAPDRPGSRTAGAVLGACLAASCEKWRFDAALLRAARMRSAEAPAGREAALLQAAALSAQAESADQREGQLHEQHYETLQASELGGMDVASLRRRRYLTDWREPGPLVLRLPRLDPQGLFQPDKTYLMVGAAGGLGLSICRWMIRNGARHLAITSRNPQVDPAMLQDARRVGATVRVLQMDVAKRDSVEAGVGRVRDTMPPIAGVCNAAMVLSDRLFLDMGADQLNTTLAAKVDGTENLDLAFPASASCDDAPPLDFFVLLSSSATVVGNIGQANYHAANLFMADVVARRRARGLAASIIHVGYVSDVGYVTRNQTRQLDQHFHSMRLMALSETDVHHAFAEAVRGGAPDSAVGAHDIIMGLQPAAEPIAPGTETPWLADPRFGHLVPSSTTQARQQEGQRGGGGGGGSTKQEVEDVETEDEAVQVVLAAFCAKLEAILQLPAGTVGESAQRAIIDLGIDSLVAVEVRTWFLKELGVDVPVVKILGGDTAVQLCTAAAKKVLAGKMTARREPPPSSDAPVRHDPTSLASRDPAPVAPLNLPPEPPADLPANEDRDASASSDSPGSSKESAASPSEAGDVSSEPPSCDSDTAAGDLGTAVWDKKTPGKPAPAIIREERMSPAQARIWFLSKLLSDPAAYNMVFHYRVRGPLSLARLRHALQATTNHHECLRMCFYSRLSDGHPMQGVMASSAYELEHLPRAADDDDLHRVLDQLKTRAWDLEAGKTLAVSVLSRSEEEHDLVFGYHHIVTDVVGWQVFLQDLDRAYRMRALDRKAAGSHVDLTALQLAQQRSAEMEEHLRFWRDELAGGPPEDLPLLPMASAKRRPANQDRYRNHHEYRELPSSWLVAVKDTCQRLRVSPFHLHLAVFQVMLARYAGRDDICVGVVDANRNDARSAGMVGCFVNMLPVRGLVPEDAAFSDIARAASRGALAARAHAAVPLDMILDAARIPRAAGTTPLFQAAVNYRTGSVWDLPLGDHCRMALSLDDGKDAETPYDISLGVSDSASGGCVVELHCQSALYDRAACHTLLSTYLRLVDAVVADPGAPVGRYPMHNEIEVARALELGRGPQMQFGWPATLSQRLLDVCRLHPDQPAVISEDENLSYAQLRGRVHAVARTLLQTGGGSGARVAVLCEPSADSVVAMLAILHVGAVYVPLDCSLPPARHAAMIRACKPAILLSHQATERRAAELIREAEPDAISRCRLLRVDGEEAATARAATHVDCLARADEPAVLLFTSGSTGVPKGILLTQASFRNFVALKTRVLGLGRERVLQQSSTGFDMAVVQALCALLNGGCLVVASSGSRRDPVETTALIRRHRVSLTVATPSEYLAWLHYGAAALRESGEAWRYACMGGEPVSRQLRREMGRLGLANLRATNWYGPTETTAAATVQTVTLGEGEEEEDGGHFRWMDYAVGKALPNCSVSILDASGKPQPVGHTGEICIGGAGVALGYLDQEEETRRRFLEAPAQGGGGKIYRTGDRGRLMADGTLLCLGRLEGDTQIKLRGLRIELQEVEAAVLQAAAGILSAVAVSRRGDVLVAFATASATGGSAGNGSGPEADLSSQVLGRLASLLPQSFIPAAIVVLPALPRNANGKLDRRAIDALPFLPQEGPPPSGTGPAVSPEKMTIREGELRLLWERVLPRLPTESRIGPSTDFFLRGGNSLLLMKLQAAIRESMGVAVTTRVLYRASTLREMSRCVEASRSAREDEAGNSMAEEPGTIDWDAETAVPSSSFWLREGAQGDGDLASSASDDDDDDGTNDGIEVLLTGATGFLGSRIVQFLVASPAVRKVHCVAVNPDDDRDLLPVAGHSSKLSYYTGSLLSPTLGLSAAEVRQMERHITVIVHAGASGHCLNSYATLRTPNLLSTRFLASLAQPRAIPLVLVSSSRVALLSGDLAPPPASAAAFAPPTDGREGYTATKWASEVFLERLHAALEQDQDGERRPGRPPWKASIHRPCITIGEGAPNSDAMNAILRYSVAMRCAPTLDNARGYLDFADVGAVARDIADEAVQLALDKTSSGEIRFRHHSSGVKVPIARFREHLEKLYGGNFDEVHMAEWIRRATDAGIDPLITAYLEGILETGAEMAFPYLGEVA